MHFGSYEFLLVFLPVTLIIFSRIKTFGDRRIATVWLIGSSLFFYGLWDFRYLWIIILSISYNYGLGLLLSRRRSRWLLTFGITCNLGMLGYYKYANFFINNINIIAGKNFHLDSVILPLAISFFTFQQVSYLVDVYSEKINDYYFLSYCLFVTFFPKLISGPLVRHAEFITPDDDNSIRRYHPENLAVGLTFFSIGLFKKTIIADQLSRYADLAFAASSQDFPVSFFEAWRGAFAYTFQLYFDFSGYSDMAVGLGRLFGMTIPVNFYSPYRAHNIIDFWRRWHITLAGFLRDYLYIPLGGNRKGRLRQPANLMITMLLCGLWHGAGWTYVLWGILHGTLLVANNFWRAIRKSLGHNLAAPSAAGLRLSRALTFLAVTLAWVLFRADNLAAAANMYRGLFGLNGVVWPDNSLLNSGWLKELLEGLGLEFGQPKYFKGFRDAIIFSMLIGFSWLLPNTQQIMARYQSTIVPQTFDREPPPLLLWQPNLTWLVFVWLIFTVSLLTLSDVSGFIYFQF